MGICQPEDINYIPTLLTLVFHTLLIHLMLWCSHFWLFPLAFSFIHHLEGDSTFKLMVRDLLTNILNITKWECVESKSKLSMPARLYSSYKFHFWPLYPQSTTLISTNGSCLGFTTLLIVWTMRNWPLIHNKLLLIHLTMAFVILELMWGRIILLWFGK